MYSISDETLDFISHQLELLLSRKQMTTNVSEDIVKQEHLYTAGGNVN
jgi:hypothetical protein